MKSHAAITKMILDTLPRNTPAAFEMAPSTLRWELNKSAVPDTLSRIEKAFRENEFVQEFTLEQGQASSTLQFVQVTYTRIEKGQKAEE